MENEAPTSAATTGATEPEVIAGIVSGEGQPVGYDFEATSPMRVPRGLLLAGTAGLLGFAFATRRRR